MKGSTAFILVSDDEVLRGKCKWILNKPKNLEVAIMHWTLYRFKFS